jgi:ketosteroid isomerase-like protein
LYCFSALSACADKEVDHKGARKKLMQISREWPKSASTDSLEKTLSYWADDAVVMSPGQPAIKGKNAIREIMISTSKIPGFGK